MWKSINRFLKPLVILLIIGVIIVSPFTVPSTSMLPTVESGDLVLVNKFRYALTTQNIIPLLGSHVPYVHLVSFGLPDRGAIVVYHFPGFRDEVQHVEDEMYMKRCIAVAGDTVHIVDDSVFVNGHRSSSDTTAIYSMSAASTKRLNESAQYTTFPKGMGWTASNYGPLRIPKRGDTLTLDTQTWRGWSVFVTREGHDVDETARTIDGVAATQYVVERDYIFCLGDNRHASVDSRYTGVVSTDHVFGSPIGVLMSGGKKSAPRFIQ